MARRRKNWKLFVLFLGVVFVWRGVWGFMDMVIFPDNEPLSFTVSLLIGLAILYSNDHKLSELL